MSYSFSVLAANKAEAKEKVAAELEKVASGQPCHEADKKQCIALADSFIDILPDDSEKDVSISMNGYLSGNWSANAIERIACESAAGRGTDGAPALATLPHYASPDGGPMGAWQPAAAGPPRDRHSSLRCFSSRSSSSCMSSIDFTSARSIAARASSSAVASVPSSPGSNPGFAPESACVDSGASSPAVPLRRSLGSGVSPK